MSFEEKHFEAEVGSFVEIEILFDWIAQKRELFSVVAECLPQVVAAVLVDDQKSQTTSWDLQEVSLTLHRELSVPFLRCCVLNDLSWRQQLQAEELTRVHSMHPVYYRRRMNLQRPHDVEQRIHQKRK